MRRARLCACSRILIWLLLLTLSACGASRSSVDTPETSAAGLGGDHGRTPPITAAEGKLPACMPAVEQPLAIPTDFPPHFPFPPGLKIQRSVVLRNDPNHLQAQIVAIAPMNLNDSAAYLDQNLRAAGYLVVRADAEQGEVDAQFNGLGWVGSYRINDIFECREATTWTIRVLKL